MHDFAFNLAILIFFVQKKFEYEFQFMNVWNMNTEKLCLLHVCFILITINFYGILIIFGRLAKMNDEFQQAKRYDCM